MGTNKVVLRTTEEFMADYTPVYQPMYPLLMGKSQSYSEVVGKINFNRVTAVGDIRAKHITPKDTEIRQFAVADGKKSFKKYFLANQFTMSALQDQSSTEDVVAQVLDEHQKQADEILLLGDGGTSGSDVVNNGLYWSADPNYVLETSKEIDNANAWLTDLHAQIVTSKIKADLVAGRKLVVFYGALMMPKVNGLYAASAMPFKGALQQVLGANYSIAELPADITPANANGWMIINLDQVKLHYVTLPQLKDQGVNDEKMYSWFNFMMGSMMLEVLASKAIIRQPVTFEAA